MSNQRYRPEVKDEAVRQIVDRGLKTNLRLGAGPWATLGLRRVWTELGSAMRGEMRNRHRLNV